MPYTTNRLVGYPKLKSLGWGFVALSTPPDEENRVSLPNPMTATQHASFMLVAC